MARVLASVWQGYLAKGGWPVFDYVEGSVQPYDLDPQEIMNEAASVGWGSIGTYGSFWTPRGGLAGNPDDQVALTVLGTHKCGEHNRPYIDFFLKTLRTLAQVFADTPIDPSLPRQCAYEWDLSPGEVLPETGLFISERLWVLNVVEHEPSPWLGGTSSNAEKTVWQITPRILPFANVETIEQYLTVLVSLIARPPRAATRTGLESTLSLPEAVDYLDTVWELMFKGHLFKWAGATKTVELILPCATSEEFRSRVGALADLVNQMMVPETNSASNDPSLQRLKAFAKANLSEEAARRIEDAVEQLRAIVAIRSGDAHHGARPRGARGFDALGIDYPPHDWGLAWEQVQSAAVAALNIIRQEIRSGGPHDSDGSS